MMGTAMSLTAEFSSPAVHEVVYADTFCPFALEIRHELLRHPDWKEMTQGGRYEAASHLRTDHQNGITSGHLDEQQRAVLPHTMAFRDLIARHAIELAGRVGAHVGANPEIEMNAMAYGNGAWLSAHTDYRSDETRPRLVAWMLYLTHPDDGEWSPEMGGAVRLFEAKGRATVVRPRFNRFAMFRVSDQSLHEIEPVTFAGGWDRSRLALSGWIRGADDSRPSVARLYARRADAARVRAERDARLRGAIAMYDLLRQQHEYSGQLSAELASLVAQYETERDLQASAPEGTVFVRQAPGPAGCIFVVDENDVVVYFGPRESMQ
jgi:Rps23 Pro-64 3,4-dihydroxylase Tpa1-like proline 4-hydroxylase